LWHGIGPDGTSWGFPFQNPLSEALPKASPHRHGPLTYDFEQIVRLPLHGPRLPDTLRIGTETGFTYKSELLIWLKITKAGTPRMGKGKTTRKVGETAWLMTRGKGLPILNHGVSQRILTEEGLPLVLEAPRRGHSQKPDKAYHAPRAPALAVFASTATTVKSTPLSTICSSNDNAMEFRHAIPEE
jgi:hypothetical protein